MCPLANERSARSHVVPKKSRDLPTPSTVLFRGPWIYWTTNIQLLMRFFFLNIKRNILYKSKHKGSIMKREKTSHKLEEAGYSIFLCLCGGRNTRFRFKTRLQLPHLCDFQQLNQPESLFISKQIISAAFNVRSIVSQKYIFNSHRNLDKVMIWFFLYFMFAPSKLTYDMNG